MLNPRCETNKFPLAPFFRFFFASADVDITLKETGLLGVQSAEKIVTEKNFFLFSGLNNISILQPYTRMCTNMCLLFARDTFLTFPSFASVFALLCIYTRENYSPWRLTLVAAFAILSPSGTF